MATEIYPNRNVELIAWNIASSCIVIFFVFWRVLARFKIKPRLWLSDYLMAIACLMNTAGNVMVIIAVHYGYGRLDADPFVTPARRVQAMRFLFYSQAISIYVMLVAKLSICAFLMVLNFSKSFRYVIWASVVTVVVCNFLIATVHLFGFCEPISMRWDPSVRGHCWPLKEKLASVITQGVANIIIDVVYSASPIVYIRQIMLPTRTRWAVQIVFFLALIGTAVSIVKLVTLAEAFTAKSNFLYGSVNGSIFSGAESALCIIIGSLPPLRKPFDKFLKMILPDRLMERIPPNPSFVNPMFSTKGSEVTSVETADADSAIFHIEGERVAGTTQVMVETGRGTSGSARREVWD
ncbi:hypothetical protein N431DRAFT_338461 [Stipitochalara longipes BDJ]|nr:hypothetical protein N431DRAFT_338461 [Stipitochalara longipes BDJ]